MIKIKFSCYLFLAFISLNSLAVETNKKSGDKLNSEIKKLDSCKQIYEKICPRNPKILRNATWQRECLKQKEHLKQLPPFCAKKFIEASRAQDKKIAVLSKKYKNKQKEKEKDSKPPEEEAALAQKKQASGEQVALEDLNPKGSKTEKLGSASENRASDSSSSGGGSSWGVVFILLGILGIGGWFLIRKRRKKNLEQTPT